MANVLNKGKQLEEMVIRKAKNGGHSVMHSFAPRLNTKGGSMSGGITSDRPPAEEHSFGPGDNQALANHVITNLGLKGVSIAGKAGQLPEEAG
jgi:hypothetical protein